MFDLYPQLHCGFYYYKNKIYINRRDAIDELYSDVERNRSINRKKANNSLQAEMQFYFNEGVFRHIDWSIEPELSLKDLYKMRCQQLRDTYDYLILSYSGGADSHEILCTFLENDIFIDEIQTVHYSKLTSKFDKNVLMKDPAIQQLLEYDYVVVPMLDKVRSKSPATKITTLDISDNIVDDVIGKKFDFMGMGKYSINATFIKQTTPFARNFFQQHHNSKNYNPKKRTAFIRGVEKPNLEINSNVLKFRFSDVSMHTVRMMQLGEVDEIYTIENFFWSPDVPLIPIKQSHVLKKVLETDPAFYAAFMHNQEKAKLNREKPTREWDDFQNFQRRYDRILYYHWHQGMFVAPKHNKESPEFKLVSLIDNKVKDMSKYVLDEQNLYYDKKYKNLSRKDLLNKHLFTQPYEIGDLNVTWY